jgi:hypothetical protein
VIGIIIYHSLIYKILHVIDQLTWYIAREAIRSLNRRNYVVIVVHCLLMLMSLIQRENGDVLLKKGDFVIYSEHIIEIVAKTALLYQKALNRVLSVHIEAQYVHYSWFDVTLALDAFYNEIPWSCSLKLYSMVLLVHCQYSILFAIFNGEYVLVIFLLFSRYRFLRLVDISFVSHHATFTIFSIKVLIFLYLKRYHWHKN